VVGPSEGIEYRKSEYTVIPLAQGVYLDDFPRALIPALIVPTFNVADASSGLLILKSVPETKLADIELPLVSFLSVP
jgi:hypothetical protein